MPDMPEQYWESIHVKSQRGKMRCCAECRGRIEPGMNYVNIRGVWGGEFGQYLFHITCHETAVRAWKYYDEGPGIGELLEWAQYDLREHKKVPPYWPEGVGVTKVGLQRYAKDTICQ